MVSFINSNLLVHEVLKHLGHIAPRRKASTRIRSGFHYRCLDFTAVMGAGIHINIACMLLPDQ